MKVMIDNKEYEKLKEDVNDIINTKLPNYVKNQEESEPYISTIQHSGDDVVLKVEDTDSGGACVVTLQNGEFIVSLGDDTNNYILSLTNTGDFTIQSTEGETIHSLTFDSEGNLKVDGNPVGGGGSQLYQHNIHLNFSSTEILMSFITSNSTPMNANDFKTYMQNVTDWVMCTGLGTGAIIWAIKNESSTTFRYIKGTSMSDPIGWSVITDSTITDFVITL